MASKLSSREARPSVLSLSRLPTLVVLISLAATLTFYLESSSLIPSSFVSSSRFQNVPIDAQGILSRCMSLKTSPGPFRDFHSREESDRYEPGMNATLIKNAVIFTGEENGTVVIRGSIFLDKGVIKHIGRVPEDLYQENSNITVVDAKGAWVTPGLGN